MVKERNKELLTRIETLKKDHPLWGYRRIWAYLKYREGLNVNKKRIYRLMQENKLLVHQIKKLKAKRENQPRKIRASEVNQVWGIDMTKIMIDGYGWLYLVVVLDWYSKKIVGYSIEDRARAGEWLQALNKAVLHQFPEGIREQGKLFLVSDNGSQPTSERFMKECSVLGIKQIFASYNNPKGNADTERVIRTLKEDLVWPREWDNTYDFKDALDKWVNDYNYDFPHSSLGYKTPAEFEAVALGINSEIKQGACYTNLFYT